VVFLPSGEVPAPTEGSVQKERETTRFEEVGGSLGPRVKRFVSVKMLWMWIWLVVVEKAIWWRCVVFVREVIFAPSRLGVQVYISFL